jgi:vanillate/3-O-methylgallate O-demethylase
MTREIIRQFRESLPGYLPGWGGPEYSGWQDEQMSWKTGCYVGDWSFLMDIVVEGPDALRFFRETSVNSLTVCPPDCRYRRPRPPRRVRHAPRSGH